MSSPQRWETLSNFCGRRPSVSIVSVNIEFDIPCASSSVIPSEARDLTIVIYAYIYSV